MKNEKKNQRERVLEYLQRHGSISDTEARDDLGIRRVGARIFELKDRGHAIVTKMETGRNRFGEKVKYGRYYLVKDGEQNDEV